MPLDKDLALLGPPELSVDGRTLAFRERRALGLLAFLGEAGRPVSRDDAATPLWPDAEPEGRTRLRRLVYKTNDLAAACCTLCATSTFGRCRRVSRHRP